jgi:hypothetical protein
MIAEVVARQNIFLRAPSPEASAAGTAAATNGKLLHPSPKKFGNLENLEIWSWFPSTKFSRTNS